MPRGIYPWEPKNTVLTCAGYGVRYEYLATATIPEVMILRDVAAGYRSIPRGISARGIPGYTRPLYKLTLILSDYLYEYEYEYTLLQLSPCPPVHGVSLFYLYLIRTCSMMSEISARGP